MKELPKICNRLKQDLYNLYKYTQETLSNSIDEINKSLSGTSLAKLSATLSETVPDNTYINLPDGFNDSNTYILSIMCFYNGRRYDILTRDSLVCYVNGTVLVLYNTDETISGQNVDIIIGKN